MIQPSISNPTPQSYIDVNHNTAFKQFADAFYNHLATFKNTFSDIIFLCIGTDRATGDSLGPLIGHKLESLKQDHIHVFGNLESPVHAKNLEETIQSIQRIFYKPLIIAVDACLGRMEHVGYVTVGLGPLKPGAGVQKKLPEVGDISITGIVNFSGFMDMVVLQNTRLYLVMKMADLVTSAIKFSLWKHKDILESCILRQESM